MNRRLILKIRAPETALVVMADLVFNEVIRRIGITEEGGNYDKRYLSANCCRDRVFQGWVVWEPNVPLNTLHHFTILSEDVRKTSAFFKDVLGLSDGYSPEPGFPVKWLYLGGEPVIHVVHPESSDVPKAYDTGSIDHVAFNCTDYAAVKTRIEVNNANHREQTQPEIGVHQIFVECPGGVWIELVFDIEDYNTSQLIHP